MVVKIKTLHDIKQELTQSFGVTVVVVLTDPILKLLPIITS